MYRRVFQYLVNHFRHRQRLVLERSLVFGSVAPNHRYDKEILFGAGLTEPVKPNPRFGGHWLAVRGPLTVEYFLAAGLPVARFLCDPMLLVSRTIPQAEYRRRGILQAMDHPWAKESLRPPYVPGPYTPLLPVSREPQRTLYMIVQSEGVITDNLSVVMVADSLGVPVVYWRSRQITHYEPFAALDYAEATGRKSFILWDSDPDECHARLAEYQPPRLPDANRLLNLLEELS